MNIPQQSSFADLVALQNTIALILLSDDRLKNIPIMTELRLLGESDLMVDCLWTLPRNAVQVFPAGQEVKTAIVDTDDAVPQVGAGLLVELPVVKSPMPNVTGPTFALDVSIVAFEERNLNFTIGSGTLIMAEQLCQIVHDILHLEGIRGFNTFYASDRAIEPAQDWMTIRPGILCYRANLRTAVMPRPQTQRSAPVTGVFAGGYCTLQCIDSFANILYTVDGSVPAKANANAIPYVNPFQFESGQEIMWASWKDGKTISVIGGATAP